MILHLTADDICIDDDDGRIILVVHSDEGDKITVNIHAIALEFYANVRTALGPYAHEAESARAAVAAGMPLDEYRDIHYRLDHPELVTNRPVSVEDAIDAGYALDDPKSPGYHDRMVD